MGTAAAPGTLFSLHHPRYEVLESLGGGAEGRELLRVHDRLRGEEVALCAVARTQAGPAGYPRFRAVFRRLSRLDHPHLARVHDLGETGDAFYYTRELAPGKRPAEALGPGAGEGLDEHSFVQALAGLADAFAALHAAELVHGLAVPDHLRLPVAEDRLGGARLTDAGLHLLLGRTQYLASSRNYLAPELREGGEPSPASDIFGLGASLLEALGGPAALALLARGGSRPFRRAARGLDPALVDLLDRLVARDPRRRPASGLEVLRALRDPGWALPRPVTGIELLVSPLLVGREQTMAGLRRLLARASTGGAHAAEVVGARGTGRSRLLAELGREAAAGGWAVVEVETPDGVDLLAHLAGTAERALGWRGGRLAEPGRREEPVPGAAPPPSDATGREVGAEEARELEAPRRARFAAAVCTALDRAGTPLLLVADHGGRLPPDLAGGLRHLVTEAGTRALLVLASGTPEARLGLPDAEVFEIADLSARDLRRLAAPLLAEAINPEQLAAALAAESRGNPLAVRLILESWLSSGRLAFTQGRPFFDERVVVPLPRPVEDGILALVGGLAPRARDLVEVMAVWGKPLPADLAARLAPEREAPPASLVVRDAEGRLRFIADTVGSVIFQALPAERRAGWHAALLEALASCEVGHGVRAVHLLAVGRTAEAVRDRLAAAHGAESGSAWQAAFEHYRAALPHLSALPAGEVDRDALALKAIRLATGVDELAWAREALETLPLPAPTTEEGRSRRFELLLARANVLREGDGHMKAAAAYAEARELACGLERLRVDLEEARNDFFLGHRAEGASRLDPVIAELEVAGPPDLLAAALNRRAVFWSQAGKPRLAARLTIRAARLAWERGDPLRVAQCFVNLGLHLSLVRHLRAALRVLDRAREILAASPHDDFLATALSNRADVLIRLGAIDEAEKAVLHARAIRLRSGSRGRLASTLIKLGRVRRLLGRLPEAAACYREALAIAAAAEHWREVHLTRANLAVVHLDLGDLLEAERLLRDALAETRPVPRCLMLRNLGSVLRRQGRLGEALAALAEAEAGLAAARPELVPVVAIETARVHLDAGDLGAAALRLDEVPEGMATSAADTRSAYHLARGLLAAGRQEPPWAALDAATAAAREAADLPALAEALVEAVAAGLELGARRELDGAEVTWLRGQLDELEAAAAQVDAPWLTAELRALRGEVATRYPLPSLAASFIQDFGQTVLDQGAASFDALLARLIRQLGGATGALVLGPAAGSLRPAAVAGLEGAGLEAAIELVLGAITRPLPSPARAAAPGLGQAIVLPFGAGPLRGGAVVGGMGEGAAGLRTSTAELLALAGALAECARIVAAERELHAGEEVLAAENRLLRAALAGRREAAGLVGRAPALAAARARIAALGPADSPVLITGEPGTGKTLAAAILHEQSGRRGSLIVVDALATPWRLASLMSPPAGLEVLGEARPAREATLLIEEVWALDAASQDALQAVLAGAGEPRVVVTSSRDLASEARSGRFPAALARRLEREAIVLPPLRERREDLDLLVTSMAVEAARAAGQPAPDVPPEFIARAAACPWPGNLAELRHCVATAVRLATGGRLSLAPIPVPSEAEARAVVRPYRVAAREFDRRVLGEALAAAGGSVPRAARLLRLPESTFRYRARKLGLLAPAGRRDSPRDSPA